MKLIYISNSRLPSEYAHGLQVMQMCEAFSANNHDVKLVMPSRINRIKKDPFDYYGIKKTFSIKKLPTLDLIFLNNKNIFFLIQTLTFLLSAKIYLLFKKYDVLYTREQMVGLFFSNIVLELHLLPKKIRPFHLRIWKKSKKLIVLTSFIKKRLIEFGISGDKIIVASDGVNLPLFDISISKEDARRKTNLPLDKKIVGYVGMLRTLGMEKGVDIALKSLSEIKNPDIIFVLVGGTKEDIDFYGDLVSRLGIKERVLFVGSVAHSLVPVYLKAFDVLLAPFPENEHYNFYMSPMKIFEYMASKRPIISTKLPTLIETLGDSALLLEPDNIGQLRDGITKVLNDRELVDNLSLKAYNRVLGYTWESRAKSIIEYVKFIK